MGNLFSGEDFDDSIEPQAGGAMKAPPIAGGDDSVEIADGDAGGSSVPRKEGWLVKQGHLIKNWKRRWFVLEYPLLHYYKTEDTTVAPRGTIDCGQVTLSETAALERTGKENCFMVHHPDRKIYYLQSEDEADMMSWVKAIRNERKVGLIDFEEISMIGKGNFGLVKLVRQKATQKLFAMKVLSKEQVIKRKDVEHTKTERNVLRRIRHPFVVQLHFAFQTGASQAQPPANRRRRTLRSRRLRCRPARALLRARAPSRAPPDGSACSLSFAHLQATSSTWSWITCKAAISTFIYGRRRNSLSQW